jgi:hypothetical protein
MRLFAVGPENTLMAVVYRAQQSDARVEQVTALDEQLR